jgi:LysR family transcriptional regulator, chromosome initiation inhibitor
MIMIPSELIETLSTVVRDGTFDAAARTLHVTPSAVSQRIKVLEQRVGRVLVVRSRPVRATEAGEALLRLGQQLALLETETLRQLGTERDDDGFTTLPIAVDADSLATWILPPLARVAAREPVVLHLVRDDQDHTADLLASGAVMAAVTSSAVPVAGCTSTRLGRMRFRAHATPQFAARCSVWAWRCFPTSTRRSPSRPGRWSTWPPAGTSTCPCTGSSGTCAPA